MSTFDIKSSHTEPVAAGTIVRFRALLHRPEEQDDGSTFDWSVTGPYSTAEPELHPGRGPNFDWSTAGRMPGSYDIRAVRRHPAAGGQTGVAVGLVQPQAAAREDEAPIAEEPAAVFLTGTNLPDEPDEPGDEDAKTFRLKVVAAPTFVADMGAVPVSLQRTNIRPTADQVLWVIIRNRTNAVGFRSYKRFMDGVLCGTTQVPGAPSSHTYRGAHAYDLLVRATDAFLQTETGVIDPENDTVPPYGVLDARAAVDDIERQLRDPEFGRRMALEERGRLGRELTGGELESLRLAYFDDLLKENGVLLPYLGLIRERLADIPLKGPEEVAGNCYGILRSELTGPLAIELLWSYWHEEGMLVQTLNSILARFQNRRLTDGPDPLTRFDLDPLRPLSNLFWGWVQDESRRLTVRRRSYEYDHEYGLRLLGKAVPEHRTVDSRSKFLEAFHNLLYLSHVFFKEDDDTTVLADGFPLLNALRETHLILSEGAHNQFGDLPSTARAEMLIMQWLLARPEMREFLGGRVMVPYEEPWMDRVDTVKSMQGWTDVSITHFRDLAVYGEQIVLSVRYGNWTAANDPQQAANWARYWRPEIQRYVHAYRSATGVDLTERVEATPPAILLQRRLATGAKRRA